MKKRILIVLLVLVLCLSVFVACDKSDHNDDEDPAVVAAQALQKARDYVKALYRDEAEKTTKDMERPTSVELDGVTYTITWTVADSEGNATDAATVGEPKDGKVTISINRNLKEDTNYVLTATVKNANGDTKEAKFNHMTPVLGPKADYLDDVVASPVAGTEYKLALWQNSEGKVYYATGAISGRYLSTTDKVSEAAPVTVEVAEGGYYIKINGKYLTILGEEYKSALSTSKPQLTDEAKTVFSVGKNHELIFTASVEGYDDATYYIGTYSTYNTIGASATSYIADTSKIDDSQYPARIVKGTEINSTSPDSGDDTPSWSAAATIDCTQGAEALGLTVTKTGDFTDYQGAASSGGIQKSFTKDGVSFVNDIASSTSEVVVSSDNKHIRCYKSSTVTIGYTGMTKIVITAEGEAKYQFKGSEALNVPGATITVEGATATITFTEAVDSVTITLSANQVRIKTIEIYTAA